MASKNKCSLKSQNRLRHEILSQVFGPSINNKTNTKIYARPLSERALIDYADVLGQCELETEAKEAKNENGN